jgi:flagellar biosynthesis protein FlhA
MNNVPNVMEVYTIASVGDGLVSQLPALLISTATGMVVTRAASESSLSKDIIQQFARIPTALIISGIGMLTIGLLLGFTMSLFVGAIMFTLGLVSMRNQRKAAREAAAPPEMAAIEDPFPAEMDFYRDPRNIYDDMEVHIISVEFGYSLLPLIEEKGNNFEDRLTNFKRKFASEMGIVIPEVTFLDNLQITPNTYVIKIKDEFIASGEILPGHYLIMDSSGMFGDIDGIDTTEPAFGFPAKWILASGVERAEILGYSVIDPQSVILTHLCDIIKNHAYEFIGRTEIEQLLGTVAKKNPSLVQEVIPGITSIAMFQKILVNLLREHVPVKDLTTILETIAEYGPTAGGNVDLLTEYCRQALKRTITRLYVEDGTLNALMLDVELETTLWKSMDMDKGAAAGVHFNISANMLNGIIASLAENLAKLDNVGYPRIIITSPVIRIYFKQFIDQFVPDLIVLSSSEIDTRTQIHSFGIIKADAA